MREEGVNRIIKELSSLIRRKNKRSFVHHLVQGVKELVQVILLEKGLLKEVIQKNKNLKDLKDRDWTS